MENHVVYQNTQSNQQEQHYQHNQTYPHQSNINMTQYTQPSQVRFVAFRNIMMPMSNLQNFQNDYNNTDVQVEVVDDSEEIKLLDNSYENTIIQNTVDSVSKVHNMKVQNNPIIKDDTGKFIYKQEIPMATNINNISQRLFQEIRQHNDFKHITIEDIRNLIFKRNIREWNQSIIQGFVKELRAFSNEKSVFMKNVHANQQPQITQPVALPQINTNTRNNLSATPSSIETLQKKLNTYEKERELIRPTESGVQTAMQTARQTAMQTATQTTTFTFSMTINSDDRNKELYPSSYDFKMIFENKNENIKKIKGTIYQNMEHMVNINKIQITSVIIPSNNELENLPYLLLEIEEIGGNGTGSNEWLDKCLGKLFFSQKIGKFHIHTDKVSTIPVS